MCKTNRQDDISMYLGLYIHFNNFEKMPNYNDFGIAGVATSYIITINGEAVNYKLNDYLKNNGASQIAQNITYAKITMNFGILSYLLKKAEGKKEPRALVETGLETISSTAFSKLGTKASISIASRILAGSATGATIGTSFPIVGTIVGAVVGAFIAGFAEDLYFGEGIFEDKDKEQKLDEQQTQDKLCEIYINKLNLIKDYLLRNNYIELRVLTESESEELCKFLVNPK